MLAVAGVMVWCAARAKGTYLRALFGRFKARRGPRKAIVAVAAAILTAAYWAACLFRRHRQPDRTWNVVYALSGSATDDP